MNPAPNATVSKERSSGNGGSQDARNTSTSLPRLVKPVLSEEMLARFASRAAAYTGEKPFL